MCDKEGGIYRSKVYTLEGRLTAGSPTAIHRRSPMKRKENDLNQKSFKNMLSAVYLQGGKPSKTTPVSSIVLYY